MYISTRSAYRDNGELVLATDKRGLRLKPMQGSGEGLPITELGSKAVYEVYAEQFMAVTA
jgi:hypothetical protein